MTKLSIVNAEVGSKDTVAEPRVTNALKAIEEFINGKELDGATNIKAASIEEGNLTAAVTTLLNAKSAFALSLVKKNEASFSIASGELVLMEKEASEVKLPAATLNRIVGIICANAIVKITVKAPVVQTIFGQFLEKETTITLARNQTVILEADGTNWWIIAGEPKREQLYTVPIAYSKAQAEAGVEPSPLRPTFVTLSATWTSNAVKVGGKQLTVQEGTGALSFWVNPGQSWVTNVAVSAVTLLL